MTCYMLHKTSSLFTYLIFREAYRNKYGGLGNGGTRSEAVTPFDSSTVQQTEKTEHHRQVCKTPWHFSK